MTAFFPAGHARSATEALARSALPGAPVRPAAPARKRRRGRLRLLWELLVALPPHTSEVEDPQAAWREAAAASAVALSSWHEAEPPDRPEAHAVYRAALDREEAAARELVKAGRRRLPERARRMLRP
jgi:hypothetical protein